MGVHWILLWIAFRTYRRRSRLYFLFYSYNILLIMKRSYPPLPPYEIVYVPTFDFCIWFDLSLAASEVLNCEIGFFRGHKIQTQELINFQTRKLENESLKGKRLIFINKIRKICFSKALKKYCIHYISLCSIL